MFITEQSVVAKTEVKTQVLRNHISFIFDGNERYGSRKGTIQKYFANPKNIHNRYLLDKSLLKSLSNRQNKFKSVTFYLFTELYKTLDLADHYFFNPLERLDISSSNSQPKPRKVQISHSPGTDDSKTPVSSPSFPF